MAKAFKNHRIRRVLCALCVCPRASALLFLRGAKMLCVHRAAHPRGDARASGGYERNVIRRREPFSDLGEKKSRG